MIEHWDVIYIGHPSRNPYWGEPRDEARRTPVCTCTLITGRDFRLLVDPSFADPERMGWELSRRSGLEPDEVEFVFVTHAHGDHTAGLGNFPRATWLAGPGTARALNASGRLSGRVESAEEHLPEGLELLPTPGHTPDICSLLFEADGMTVAVAGDTTVARDFCLEGLSSFGEPTEQEKASVRKLTRRADAVVPGHGNWFVLP